MLFLFFDSKKISYRLPRMIERENNVLALNIHLENGGNQVGDVKIAQKIFVGICYVDCIFMSSLANVRIFGEK